MGDSQGSHVSKKKNAPCRSTQHLFMASALVATSSTWNLSLREHLVPKSHVTKASATCGKKVIRMAPVEENRTISLGTGLARSCYPVPHLGLALPETGTSSFRRINSAIQLIRAYSELEELQGP